MASQQPILDTTDLQHTAQDGTLLGPNSTVPPPTGGPPQLPPQMFTTAAQLLDLTDKKLILVLRDGRKLLGVLRSWDQFANLVLTDTQERYYAITADNKKLTCSIPRGTYLVRGENVLLLGEVDLDRDGEDEDQRLGWEQGDVGEVFGEWKRREGERMKKDKRRQKVAGEVWGGELEGSGEVLF